MIARRKSLVLKTRLGSLNLNYFLDNAEKAEFLILDGYWIYCRQNTATDLLLPYYAVRQGSDYGAFSRKVLTHLKCTQLNLCYGQTAKSRTENKSAEKI